MSIYLSLDGIGSSDRSPESQMTEHSEKNPSRSSIRCTERTWRTLWADHLEARESALSIPEAMNLREPSTRLSGRPLPLSLSLDRSNRGSDFIRFFPSWSTFSGHWYRKVGAASTTVCALADVHSASDAVVERRTKLHRFSSQLPCRNSISHDGAVHSLRPSTTQRHVLRFGFPKNFANDRGILCR